VTDPQFPEPGSTDIALSVRTHDRVGERRTDEAWLTEAWTAPTTRIVPVAGTKFPVDEAGEAVRWHTAADLPATGMRIFLGSRDDIAHFALVVDEPLDEGRWTGFRGVVQTLPEPDAGFMVHAIALAEWHASHRFCPRDGSRLVASDAGHVLRCEAEAHQQFPRTDPAVIMMVTDGDRALLGRQASWPEGRYSTLAGFVDPGESLEEAVVREVAEETGVEVGEVSYFGAVGVDERRHGLVAAVDLLHDERGVRHALDVHDVVGDALAVELALQPVAVTAPLGGVHRHRSLAVPGGAASGGGGACGGAGHSCPSSRLR